MWSSRLTFDLRDDDDAMFRIVEWLESRKVPHCMFYSYSAYGKPKLFNILLLEENDVDAVYLSLWDGCLSVRRITEDKGE